MKHLIFLLIAVTALSCSKSKRCYECTTKQTAIPAGSVTILQPVNSQGVCGQDKDYIEKFERAGTYEKKVGSGTLKSETTCSKK